MRGLLTLANLMRGAVLSCCLATVAGAQELVFEKTAGSWISSEEYLKQAKPEFPEFQIHVVAEIKRIAVTSLRNPEQAKDVQKLQADTGMRSKDFGEGFLSPNFAERATDADSTKGVRWEILKNMRNYAGKEVRLDFIPESFKSGLRFDFSQRKSAPVQHRPQPVRYGLILKDIEPSEQKFALAALGSDYALVEHAPKAQLKYDVGPLPPHEGAQNYPVHLGSTKKEDRHWTSYLPDYRFRGKISPRGTPTPEKPLPDQVVTIEQVEGLYAMDVEFLGGKGSPSQNSLIHRFHLPIYDRTNIYEEYDDQFRPRKVVLSDYFYYGPFSANLERHFTENRYQAGFFYRQNHTQVHLTAHTPNEGLARDVFWSKHHWDIGFQTAF